VTGHAHERSEEYGLLTPLAVSARTCNSTQRGEWFAPTVELAVGPKRLLACHAVPSSYDSVVLPSTEDEFRAHLEGVDADVVAAGHVHLQFVRRAGGTLWVNPGSVGLSYDHEQPEDDFRFDPWAAYGLLSADEEGRLAVELRRVPVDVDAIVARVEDCGMPEAAEGAWRWRPRD
jgi:diadenosine tetraphosphatase ApaH/serine/threonine PP2A family protein phosphatase